MNKDTIHIRLDLQNNYGSYTAAIEVDSSLEESFEPLRMCTEPWMTVTGDVLINDRAAKKVIKVRENAAKELATQLTQVLIDAMAHRDTIDGYSK